MSFNRLRYWRVMDDASRATFDEDGNIVAGSNDKLAFKCRTFDEKEYLCELLEAHLHWKNREDTPFISVYGDMAEDRAMQEAKRRVRHGQTNVILVEIILEGGPRVDFRRIATLEREIQLEVPDQAKHNAEYEFVFLHYIPAKYIANVTPIYDD